MNYGRGAALALPIVGNFWYKLSIDPKFAKLTQEEFKKKEKIIAEMNCLLLIRFFLLINIMCCNERLTLKDSLLRTGFSGLREMVEEMFPEEVEEPIEENSDGEGGIIEDIELPEVKKNQNHQKHLKSNLSG
ncbi:MAG: hypothetical protein IPN46_09390 [Saprospiraceae bacterium]|nr:hypothetical protein [Saprospiraceae bacterium]